MPRSLSSEPGLIYQLRTVTQAAAIAVQDWVGRCDKNGGDGAAVEAMRAALARLPIDGTIVIGEGEKDEAPALYNGERVGSADGGLSVDIAVDPVEGTTYMSQGMTNSMAVLTVAPRGSLFSPGPAFYMDKLAVPPAARGAIDPAWPTARRLAALAEALRKPVRDLTIYLLEKPRHKTLIEEITAAGARVVLYPAGDVAGALLSYIPGSGIDALMGTGGTPEGVIAACAARALGGELFGRLDPQRDDERRAVAEAGLSTERWYRTEELVTSTDVLFCATGVTDGFLFDGVRREGDFDRVQTLMISGVNRERQVLTSFVPRGVSL